MKQGVKEGYESVEFIGGEPTIYKDIMNLVSSAKKLGYQNIMMTTNGRMFSYKAFSDRIFKAGLNSVSFSLYSHKESIHEGTTRTKGSFRQCVDGIKNALGYEAYVSVNTVVYKANYGHLTEFGSFLDELGVRDWSLLDLLPDGDAKEMYSRLCVRLPELSNEMNKLISLENIGLWFYDFPHCIFKKDFLREKNVNIEGVETRNSLKQEVYGKSDRTKEINGFVYDNRKILTETCKRCVRLGNCGGLWEEYFKYYKDWEIRQLAEKHGFLRIK